MPPALSVSYSLQPPSTITAPPQLSPTTKHNFSLQIKSCKSTKTGSEAHYKALRDSIAQARDLVGKELTAWRDAVGDGEKEETGGGVNVDEEVEGEA